MRKLVLGAQASRLIPINTIIGESINTIIDAPSTEAAAARSSNMTTSPVSMTILRWLIVCIICHQFTSLVSCQDHQQKHQGPFPGVSKDLGSFCAARPSLPIDLASMIVHTKRNVSFNYKLYLFSSDHVFQTGQVIPRDDFRVHSFPVRVKRFQEFWPSNLTTGPSSLAFDLKEFFRLVPLNEPEGRRKPPEAPHDAAGDALPGDAKHDEPFISHDVAHSMAKRRQSRAAGNPRRQASETSPPTTTNLNRLIEFDRDDQISRLNLHHSDLSSSSSAYLRSPESHTSKQRQRGRTNFEELVLPVGSFSSFHVNLTYLVRKDFDQAEPQIIKLLVDANKFQVTQWEVINDGTIRGASSGIQDNKTSSSARGGSFTGGSDDFAFLSHKLLRDPNTRITSINQIYENWITRNYYTIVYVQRRLLNDHDDSDGPPADDDDSAAMEEEAGNNQRTTTKTTTRSKSPTLINDRLVFRGSSMALLGADQLDYQVKAAAFITEKNGLHYYLEFLNTGKFYLCAVDWHKRPFKIIDWQQFPIKATRTQFDNEELLLCPPAVCYSQQPIDEIVAYGRLALGDQIERQIRRLSLVSPSSSSHQHSTDIGHQQLHSSARNQLVVGNSSQQPQVVETAGLISLSPAAAAVAAAASRNGSTTSTMEARLRGRSLSETSGRQEVGLSEIIEAVKISADRQQQVKLHLRDWVWTLAGGSRRRDNKPTGGTNNIRQPARSSFGWRYGLAKRNDIKAKPDAYGYTLAGHEIDASYRIYNELYLISANHLIAINYTLANETVVSSIPVSEEFPGLISTIIDPITGAFYDRPTNRLYFFKGERYIGFDYATRRALEDFILKPSYLHSALWGDSESEAAEGGINSDAGLRLLSSRPVVEILGRQHQVDAIYHDFATDLVYIFQGMKFYSFHANEFKDGVFRSETGELPQMHCINERFLEGCTFDKAYPNPCQSSGDPRRQQSSAKLVKLAGEQQQPGAQENDATIVDSLSKSFNQEQQLKLRSIASKAGLLNVLVENSLIGKGIRTLEPLIDNAGAAENIIGHVATGREDQDRLIIYLLLAIVAVTILVTIVMILVMVSSSSSRRSKSYRAHQAVLDRLQSNQLSRHGADKISVADSQAVKRSTNHHYLTNQHPSRLRPYHVPSSLAIASSRPSVKPADSLRISKGRHVHRDDIVDNSVL